MEYTVKDEDLMCTCGHTMRRHHLMFSMKVGTNSIFPSECLAYGSNEDGGTMPNPDPNSEEQRIDHCYKFTPVKEVVND
jgi:hypothetical protein